eukprot:9213142-Prorocentrum_lima.AAC.1
MQQPCLLAASPAGPHFLRILADAHENTWFQVTGAAPLAATSRGSRPGDPLADATFSVLLAL